MVRCTLCHTLIQAGEASLACEDCRQEYHQSCWDDLGGCGTYGCRSAPAAEKPPLPPVLKAGWGDEKNCPSCNRVIGSSLLACRCGARFPYADPMTREQYVAWFREHQSLKRTKTALVTLFVISLAGLTAPVCGAIAGFIAIARRRRLAGAEGVYLAMGYGTLALGATYACILGLLSAGL